MRRIIKGALKPLGFTNIVEAEDGTEALQELKNEKADLILCDWNILKMDGMELLNAVRSDETLKNIPFIMVTAEGQKDNVLKAVQAGISSSNRNHKFFRLL